MTAKIPWISAACACLLGAVGLTACGSTPVQAAADTAVSDSATTDATDAAASADSAPDAAAEVTITTGPTWRDSLAVCWSDLACQRVFVVSHGGDWSIGDYPYDSQGAFHRAAEKGADAIKTDVHVTKDNIAVVAHSSPIESWESPDCAGQKIEEMTAAQVTQCKLFPSETETFQRLDTVLQWARGKVVIMLTVKEPVDFPRAIATVIAQDALDYVFLETGLGDLATAIPKSADWMKSWYNASVDDEAGLDAVIAQKNPRVLFLEIGVKYQEAQNAKMSALLEQKIHPAGMRGFVSTIHLPNIADHLAIFEAGFDVIMTYNLDNALVARDQINAKRGLKP